MAVQLESDIDFRLQLENFDGPFDLLLRLIGKHELDITTVSLAKVTDDFLTYVKQLDEHAGIESASEFLVVAATLLDMKIASLLPQGEVVDAEDVALLEARDLLFARLLQYRAFKEIASWFGTALEIESSRIPREVRLEERFRNLRPELSWETSVSEFVQIAQQAFAPREIPGVGLTHLHAPKVSIREQAGIMVQRLRAAGSMSFRDLISDCKERGELVARFLGLLELYRVGAVGFSQQDPFADFVVVWEDKGFAADSLSLLGADYAD
ncbi:segregation/condensation protein A [Aquiluna borgnonia]|uniref:Segregation and condensation protein A n=1 Tax=Aquiluna borgnonia TaxID=2499157 RepID=A0A7D4U7V7_9MICO|nr:ScpA family protein [Aquiluna borgnonia]QKJ25416.1 segregation/condensation protein A [Aquiluna borgnonia]